MIRLSGALRGQDPPFERADLPASRRASASAACCTSDQRMHARCTFIYVAVPRELKRSRSTEALMGRPFFGGATVLKRWGYSALSRAHACKAAWTDWQCRTRFDWDTRNSRRGVSISKK